MLKEADLIILTITFNLFEVIDCVYKMALH